ncbi:MAG: hypothetical protein FJZ08_02270 [Candidatus Omnitrophica bacterium]|nr:hypothetical protein [Candidatus Omnitrophota bacterium]
MKAFLVGLFFLFALCLLAGIGILLTPLLLILAFFVRILVIFLLVIFAIWLLGKFIIFSWERLFNKLN